MTHTVQNRRRQVTLVLASTGGGWRSVGVGVFPFLEQVFGLLEEDLNAGRYVSARGFCFLHFLQSWIQFSRNDNAGAFLSLFLLFPGLMIGKEWTVPSVVAAR